MPSRVPVLIAVWVLIFFGGLSALAEQALFDQGDPTGYEQLMLELLNRARADPLAEAARYGLSDLNEGVTGPEITPSPKQPLVFNPFLISSARTHSQWMLDTDTFSHTGINNSSSRDRMESAGYALFGTWGTGENIAVHFDWVISDREQVILDHHEGLFLSPGHRENILQPDFDEIGIGEVIGGFLYQGINYPASSMLTQNFAHSWGSPVPDGHFLTGVIYKDTDGNGFYSTGEGVEGIEIRPATGAWYALSSGSGGYAIPVGFSGGLLELGISGNEIVTTQMEVNLSPDASTKLDLIIGLSLSMDPWAGAMVHPDGWLSLNWLGWFTRPHGAWIYHARHGFIHGFLTDHGDLYLFDPETGEWSWTRSDIYPQCYRLGPNPGWDTY